jgi:hypothetical protein
MQLALFVFSYFDGCSGGEDGINVSGHRDQLLAPPGGAMRSKDAPELVGVNIVEPDIAKLLQQPCAARLFSKWWSGDVRQLYLRVGDLAFVCAEPTECGMHVAARGHLRDLLLLSEDFVGSGHREDGTRC